MLLALLACVASDDTADTGPGTADTGTPTACPDAPYAVRGAQLCQDGVPASWRGVNAMHVFGGDGADLPDWNVEIVREFVGNPREQPLTGEWAIEDSTGAWLHPLEGILDGHHEEGRVTVLCPFAWDGEDLLGDAPSETPYWEDVQAWLTTVAAFTADRPDVWLEVWNEPYHWQGTNQTDEAWAADMAALVEAVRSGGNSNLVVVPAGRMGQGDAVLHARASGLQAEDEALLFDLHLYERWMIDRTTEQVAADLDALAHAGIPLMIGEIAPMNAGELMDPGPVLEVLSERELTTTAWLWKYDESDPDALLTTTGAPNDQDNNAWGTTYREFLARH